MDLRSVEAFLDLVKDPKKFEAKMKEMVDQEKRLKKAVELTGKVSEISKMHEQTKQAVQKAEDMLRNASEDSLAIETAAKKEASELKSKAKVALDKAVLKKNQAEKDAIQADELKSKAAEQLQEIEKIKESLLEKMRFVSDREAKLLEKEKRLKAIL